MAESRAGLRAKPAASRRSAAVERRSATGFAGLDYELDAKITDLCRELDKLIQRRTTLIGKPGGLGDFSRQSRDVLSGVYRNEMKRLGDFGFDVLDSPKVKKPSEKKTVTGQ